VTEVTIYTSGGVVSYVLRATTKDFKRDLIAALEQGTVTVETLDGSSLIINPLNAAAIEVKDSEDTPPGADS
jgi:hypothetical protein